MITGVLVKSFLIAAVPLVALSVAVTFSFYAVARKGLKVDPTLGLFVETSMLLPMTLTFLAGWSCLISLFFWRRCYICFSDNVCWCADGGTFASICYQ